jgi:hypothetical protein
MNTVMPRWLRSILVLALVAPASCSPQVSQVPLGMGPQALAESAAPHAHAASKPHAPHRSEAVASVEPDDAAEDDEAEPADAEAGSAASAEATAKAPAEAAKAATFKGMYAGTDIATYRLDGLPDRRDEDDRAKIRVEADGDDAINIVIISSDTGEDLCELSASISGKVATLTGSSPCFTNPDDDSLSAMVTAGRATLKDDELKVTAEGTMNLNLADQSLSGTLSYTFKGRRQ